MTLQCVVILINPDNSTAVQSAVWSRNGMPVRLANGSLIPNHSTEFNSTTGGFTDLVITDVRLGDDNTMYSCSATGTIITSSVVLNVAGKLYVCMCTYILTYSECMYVRIHTFIANYRIRIIGKSNIWRLTQKCYWWGI